MEVTVTNYPQQANRTERIPKDLTPVLPKISYVLSELLKRAIDTAKFLDQVKRHIYYDKPMDARDVLLMEKDDVSAEYPAEGFKLTPEQWRILHACLGLLTEAGELAEAVRANLVDGKPLDKVNIMEEIGDVEWYCAIPINLYGWTLEQVLQANVEKLKKRYPQGWNQEDAVNRDLTGERKTLESHQPGAAPGS